MKITVRCELDLTETIEEHANDVDLSGLGSREDSEYVLSSTVVDSPAVVFDVFFEVDHESGLKNASRESVVERFVDALNEIEGMTASAA